ncbi:hypothetical protein E2C01_013115 [Portunus trituberculatus]|uniref:Uncharacterized protein n=1 Tax=Portunus trituberculatus TaxID=210409 RepID=A0A5B7DG32_PORTR|nr:hypothetical protein [Portunus trituberculatus]
MAFTPAVTGSIVTPRARLKSQRDLHLPQSQQQRHAGWSAGRQQGSASPMPRSATLTRKHREHRPSQSHLNMDQEDSVPLAASRTTEGLQTNLRSSTLPISASYSQHFSAASQQGRGVPPVRHSLSIGSQYHHPLSDPFRGEFLIKTLSGTTSERHQVSGSDSALRKRMGTSEQNYVSKAAVNNQEMANSAYIHGRKDGSDLPQMEHGFGGNLLDVEPLQQSEVKTEPVVVATTPLVPAQKSSDPAERRDTTQVSPSKDHPHKNSPLRSLFSSPMLLLLGVVFAASAAYMAIVMEEQGALQRLQQAQLTAAFGGQPFLEGRRKRSLLTHKQALSRITASKARLISR